METARTATAGDLSVLAELATGGIAHQRAPRGGMLGADREARAEPLSAGMEADLTDPSVLVVLGAVDDVPVGYGVVRREAMRTLPDLAVVTDLWVDPEARGVGVGEAIMDELVAWAREHGCVGIDALALPGDRATKNFFERFGLTARAILVHRSLDPTGR
jgi:ribosomal protein S18 acetylase RimI-like enzyme